jgi:Na+-transporting NADH:ubiquinone oxidoreductase subunit C
MANETISKTLLVAVLLCVVCSVLVSAVAVRLKPIQEENRALFTKKNILAAAGLMSAEIDVEAAFARIDSRVVDLATGEYDDTIDPSRYDQRAAAKQPQLSVAIPPVEDLAGIGRRAKKALVYQVKTDGAIETIILPIHGKGLWSTMYAFLALAPDGNTIKGYTFYEHGETPGLGGEVDNPLWRRQWDGKRLYRDDGSLAITVVKGKVNPDAPDAIHQADGLSGATLTTVGIHHMMRYWLGENGFKPYLSRMHHHQGEDNGQYW